MTMIEKLASLWETKRWLFWVLFIVTIPAICIKFYLDYLEHKSREDLKDTQREDHKLEEKQKEYESKADKAKNKADKLEEKIENRKEDDIDEDWHLKE